MNPRYVFLNINKIKRTNEDIKINSFLSTLI